MTDKKASEETLAASVADADFWAGVKSAADVRFTFALVKTWIKSWIAKGDVGLGNVDNTSDASKPISTATQNALDLKANISSLGTAAAADTTDFATAAQGGLADTAVQPGDLGALAAKNKADVPGDLNVTGIPDGSKFLRDDGSWQNIAGGGDMLAANNLSDLDDAATARNNLGIIPALQNALINGAMDIWQRGTAVNCPAGSRTFLADRWFVNPAGAAVLAARSTVQPTNARSRYNLTVVGATSVTTVNVGQRIEAANIPQIKGTVIFQAQIYNGTGADFTPSLLLGTPAAADDFTTVTNRLTQVLQSVVSGAGYTQVSFSVDISGYTNIDNGLQVEIQIPSGSLDSGAKDIKVTEVSLQLGTVATTFERPPLSVTYNLCLPYYQKSFPYATPPAQNLGTFNGSIVTVTAGTAAGAGAENVRFLPPMRATPTVTTYNTHAADANWWDSYASASRAVATSDLTEKGFRATVNATTSDGRQHFIQWSANAEL